MSDVDNDANRKLDSCKGNIKCKSFLTRQEWLGPAALEFFKVQHSLSPIHTTRLFPGLPPSSPRVQHTVILIFSTFELFSIPDTVKQENRKCFSVPQ